MSVLLGEFMMHGCYVVRHYFQQAQTLFSHQWKLLGDSTYISSDFFVIYILCSS